MFAKLLSASEQNTDTMQRGDIINDGFQF